MTHKTLVSAPMHVTIDLLNSDGEAGFPTTFTAPAFRSDLPLPLEQWQQEVDRTVDPSMHGQTFEMRAYLSPVTDRGELSECGLDLTYVGKAVIDENGCSLLLVVPPAQRCEDDFGYLRALSDDEITSWSTDIAHLIAHTDVTDADIEAFIAAHSSIA